MTPSSHFSKPRWPHVLAATGLCAVLLGSASPASVAQSVRIAQPTAENQELAQASQLNQQVIDLEEAGRYADAIPLAEQALAIREQRLGPDHPDTVTSLTNLARLYTLAGSYEEAEVLLQGALRIYEQEFGPSHAYTTISQFYLAQVYRSLGRYEEAEVLLKLNLAVHEQESMSSDSWVNTAANFNIVANLNTLAQMYSLTGRYEEAEVLLRRALRIYEQDLYIDNLQTVTLLSNLAYLYQVLGRYEEAEALLQRVLARREQELGDHPDTATSLHHLAQVYRSLGRNKEAEALFQRALSIYEQELDDHRYTATSLFHLASLHHEQGQLQSALTYLSRSIAIEETVLSRNLVSGSDANKRKYLDTVTGTTNFAIRLNLNDLPSSSRATQLAFTTILQRKGRILDLFTNLRAQLGDNPEALALLNDLNAAITQLTNLTYNQPTDISDVNHQAQLNDLVNDLEAQLSRLSIAFANLTASPTLAEIQSRLPAGTALVEFIRYRAEDYHYAAYVLKTDGTIQGIDLGPAEAVDAAVRTLTMSLASPNAPQFQVKEAAQALETLVMAPVRAVLGDVTTVFLSPEDALNLIPFEALVDASGHYLVESYQFRYLTSGRDLMRLGGAPVDTNSAVLIGNPTYGRPGELVAQADIRAIDFKNRIFPALPGTQQEVDLIAPKLAGAEVYTQTNATEAVLKQQVQLSILHIATHGFFEQTEETLNPLLQSGLILAGAAAGGQSGPDQDGILTALEVTGMNLRGTQLVVLSACETGRGALAADEGVYGLRRAFVLAGAQSQVISLWKVSDTATQELMVDYYDLLLSGMPRDAALRETQLAFLNHEEYSHPYYWAAFIGSGDWRPLQQ